MLSRKSWLAGISAIVVLLGVAAFSAPGTAALLPSSTPFSGPLWGAQISYEIFTGIFPNRIVAGGANQAQLTYAKHTIGCLSVQAAS